LLKCHKFVILFFYKYDIITLNKKKGDQMKKAFTMIELIFVIVILGILAAVALPKFMGVSQQAHEANLKAFVGTLNRTVGASLWSQSMTDGNGGSIKSYTQYNDSNFTQLSDIPKEINASSIDFGNCLKSGDNYNNKYFAEANASITGAKYEIICRDGNSTTPPAWVLLNKDNKCIAGPCDILDIDKNTIK
jgi:prepilin-type N-terminal cleavage/methylation domain-containing protein